MVFREATIWSGEFWRSHLQPMRKIAIDLARRHLDVITERFQHHAALVDIRRCGFPRGIDKGAHPAANGTRDGTQNDDDSRVGKTMSDLPRREP